MSTPRGEALKYPERVRCLKCGRFFGPLVIDGLYDSYECAGRKDPADVPEAEWPRKHYYPKEGRRIPKRAFNGPEEGSRLARLLGKDLYPCDFCGQWHIGTDHREGTK